MRRRTSGSEIGQKRDDRSLCSLKGERGEMQNRELNLNLNFQRITR